MGSDDRTQHPARPSAGVACDAALPAEPISDNSTIEVGPRVRCETPALLKVDPEDVARAIVVAIAGGLE